MFSSNYASVLQELWEMVLAIHGHQGSWLKLLELLWLDAGDGSEACTASVLQLGSRVLL